MDRRGSSPGEWIISRICEEFNCTPSEAIEEPLILILEILELRGYARAKEMLENCESEKDIKPSPSIDLVWMVQHELLKEKRSGGSDSG